MVVRSSTFVVALAMCGCARSSPQRATASVERSAADIRSPAVELPAPPAPAGPRRVIADICLNRHLHGIHVFPRFVAMGGRWSADPAIVNAPLAEAPQRFMALGYDGSPRGQMLSGGAADDEYGGFLADAAVGRLTGDPGACTDTRNGRDIGFLACGAAGGCGLGVALVADSSPPALAATITPIESCVVDGTLFADVDGDGTEELYPLIAFVDDGMAAEEVVGARADVPACEPTFTWWPVPGAPVSVDVHGVADLDGDGHRELAIAVRTATTRTIALYRAHDRGLRLRRLVTSSSDWDFPLGPRIP
jgi:hypothetical protein